MLRWLLALLFALLPAAASAQTWNAAPPQEEIVLPVVPADWTTVPGTWVRVTGPVDDTALLLRVARAASDSLPRLAERLDVPIGGTIHVYVAPTDEVFRELQPGPPPLWADATAWPRHGTVFLRAPGARNGDAAPLEQVLDHELVHVLLGRSFAPATPPRWLQEGTAQLLAGEIGPETTRRLSSGALTSSLVYLEALEHHFPADPVRAELAYAESADFVAWLEATYGEGTLPELVRATRQGDSMRQAVYGVTGSFLEDVEEQWRARLGGTAFKLAGVAQGEWAWGIGAVALIGAAIARRRRFHRRLAEMEAEEALLDSLVANYRGRIG